MPDNLLLFIGLTTLVSLAPGPNVMFIMSQAALRGHRAGMMAGLGIQVANVVYFALTLLGLGVLISTSELLFFILKWTGAGYLALIGVLALIRSFRTQPMVDPAILALVCLAVLPMPFSDLRAAVRDIFLLAPGISDR